jgi:hypothetical protein
VLQLGTSDAVRATVAAEAFARDGAAPGRGVRAAAGASCRKSGSYGGVWARAALDGPFCWATARRAVRALDINCGCPLKFSVAGRARPHCHSVPPLIHFMPDSLTYSVPLFLKRQCDRTPPGLRPGGPPTRPLAPQRCRAIGARNADAPSLAPQVAAGMGSALLAKPELRPGPPGAFKRP